MNLTEFCKKHLDKFENGFTLPYETLITLKEELTSCEEFQNCTLKIEPKGLESKELLFIYGRYSGEIILNEINLSIWMYRKQDDFTKPLRQIIFRGIFNDFEKFERIEAPDEKKYIMQPMN
jgi:hypothetical protein